MVSLIPRSSYHAHWGSHCGSENETTLVVWLDYGWFNKTGVRFYTTSFSPGRGSEIMVEIVTSQACDILCQDHVCS